MIANDTIISGNSKRIHTASPSQISYLRRQYLCSLSPNKIVSIFNLQPIQPTKKAKGLRIKNFTFEVPQYKKTPERKSSIISHLETNRLRTSFKSKSIQKKIVFQEKLRLNNL